MPSPASLFAPVCSIAPTRRRRFLWAAWWSGPPSAEPFRKPDAYSGGALTREEAKIAAEKTAGCPLVEIEPRWARAWGRMLVGLPAWLGKGKGATEVSGAASAPSRAAPRSAWQILGVAKDAEVAEIKQAFRRRALETHPDRGGDPASFREVRAAYERALARRKDRRAGGKGSERAK